MKSRKILSVLMVGVIAIVSFVLLTVQASAVNRKLDIDKLQIVRTNNEDIVGLSFIHAEMIDISDAIDIIIYFDTQKELSSYVICGFVYGTNDKANQKDLYSSAFCDVLGSGSLLFYLPKWNYGVSLLDYDYLCFSMGYGYALTDDGKYINTGIAAENFVKTHDIYIPCSEIKKIVNAEPSEDIAINSVNFPDEKFRAYVSENFDKDNNGSLTEEERCSVRQISLGGTYAENTGITTLKGIEYFENLMTLDCKYSHLTELDLSKNTVITYLDCCENEISSLNLSKNTVLRTLMCYSNKLTNLNISKNATLKGLYCYSNNLTSLDVSKNINLEYLGCDNNQIESLDVSKNINLEYLGCDNNQIESLDVSKNTNLKQLQCGNNQIKALDVSKNIDLTELSCAYNKIKNLDMKNNKHLERLFCSYNQLDSLDLSPNTAIKQLYCGNNQLVSLDLSKNTNLECLECGDNQISSLDLGENTALLSLFCNNNKLTSLDLRKNININYLTCSNNKIINLVVSDNLQLGYLDCCYNQITNLDLSKNIQLSDLNCYANYFYIGDDIESFDLAILAAGFNPAKASNWQGATYNNYNNTLTDFTSDYITYNYDCGNDKIVEFCLVLHDDPNPEPNPNPNPNPDPDPDPNPNPNPNPDPDPVPATTPVIWAGGKDIKNRTDDSKSVYYKTCSYQNEGMYSGGKWCVAVTKSDIATADDFAALFKDGKLTDAGKKNTGDAKKIASAKIKDGKITVTAGKEAGKVNVWLYEVKGKAVVNDSALGVVPKATAVSVLMAANSPVLAESLTNGVASSGVSKLEVKAAESKKLLLGDKKAAFDPTASFTLENSSTANATAVLSGNELTVTGVSAGKANITLTCDQSGKKVKLAVTCK